MPRLLQALPKYRKHRASGQAVVTLNGRDHYLGPHGTKTSKLDYDRVVGEWLASGRSPSYGAAVDDLTVVELVADYRRYAIGYFGEGINSELYRIDAAVKLLTSLYGRTAAAAFGPLELKALRERFISVGWSRYYINANTRRIVRMFRWAAADGRVSPLVPQALAMVPGLRRGKTNARETEPILPVADDVVDATLPHLSDVVADMVRLQRLTGCRPAEICALRPCDLDRTGEVWIYRPPSHKTSHHGKERAIFVGARGQEILLRYLARDEAAFCFSPRDSEAKRRAVVAAARKTPLSCGNRAGTNRRKRPSRQPGDRYDARTYYRAIRYACDRAFRHPSLGNVREQLLTAEQKLELKAWRKAHRWAPNQLRHAAATEVRREFGLEAAQVMLGHSRADVTQVYAERDLAKGVEVAKRIG
ncbi:MAG: integrase [Pirellula sp.]|nr:integrase [Pirellula sp.]